MNSVRFLLVLALLMQVGCGFHLRGSTQLPDWLSPLYVEAGELQNHQLAQIKAALQKAAARVQQRPDSAHRLFIDIAPMQSRILASSSPSGVELRRISVVLEFRLFDPAGTVLLDDQRIVHTSDVELDTTNVLSHEEIIESNHERLQARLIRSMIFKLKQL